MLSDESAPVLGDLDTGFVHQCCEVAACAIYTYDRFLTLEREVDMIWRRRSMSVATGLYLLIHMSTAVLLYSQIVIQGVSAYYSGYILVVAQSCAAALFHFAISGFTALRAYAISGRSVLLAFAIFTFYLVFVAIHIYEISTIVVVAVPDPVGCVIFMGGKGSIPSLFIGEASSIIAEALLIAATWHHVYAVNLAHEEHIETPITTVLLRDGTVYFMLQTTLMTHFYLHLHEAVSVDTGIPSDTSQVSDIRFTRVVGSLAGSLSYGTYSSVGLGGVDAGSDLDESG
ncbi:uncharacterized protein B0H18DRAFT_981684 [Fomitopsis serialis]|uniref:uncharacterized protein n=1 Tax=Fomitopsis serialis TaxID=139415 RepID=UPI0020088ECF|nr:uncharacterized protein B0H18DRAFT_981684 [Neoantrodia serialis]KAH9934400.1 hypothetical protein B0H18DRAFT_981684 [Neoantrodia serialis]